MHKSQHRSVANASVHMKYEGMAEALDMICVCVTFIDELATLSDTIVTMASNVNPKDFAERTYKIVRRPPDGLAYAISIAEKYGLTYPQLLERVQP
jgi:DNA mismatch repair protein MutS